MRTEELEDRVHGAELAVGGYDEGLHAGVGSEPMVYQVVYSGVVGVDVSLC